MSLILDAIATAAAGIPTGWKTYESGQYGSDIACGDDCDALFSEDDGTTPRAVALSIWRTITSDTDSIPDAPGEGRSITSLLRRPATRSEIRMWPSLLEGEILRDDRVATVVVRFEQVTQDTWSVSIDGTTVNGEAFDLVGQVSSGASILTQIMGASA